MIQTLFKSLLGKDGAEAVSRLLQTEISPYIAPRVIVGWLRNLPNGIAAIPNGCPVSELTKAEAGFSGQATIGNVEYKFSKNSEEQVAAIVITALGLETQKLTIRNVNLAKISKTIDALIKAEAIGQHHPHSKPEKPIPAQDAIPAEAPIPVKKKPKLIPRIRRGFKLSKTEASASCSSCKQKFFKDDKFVGCLCFSEMAKTVKTTINDTGYLLTFGSDWDEDAYLSLVNILKYGD